MNLKEKEEQIKKIVDRMKALPTLSIVVANAIQVVSNPLTSASDLSRIISVDQALTAKVLRLANSAFYGFPFRIKNITQAIAILGFDTIRNLVLTVSVYKIFTKDINIEFSHQEFWKHCVGVAICAKLLAKRIKYKSIEGAFTAGLLHDIGKNFFEEYMTNEFQQVLKYVKEHNTSIYNAEKEVIGVDHATVGKWMAEKWNLPQELVAGIGYYHNPNEEKEEYVIATIINAANILCKQKGIGFSGDNSIMPLNRENRNLLNLDENNEKALIESLDGELKEAEAFLSIPQ